MSVVVTNVGTSINKINQRGKKSEDGFCHSVFSKCIIDGNISEAIKIMALPGFNVFDSLKKLTQEEDEKDFEQVLLESPVKFSMEDVEHIVLALDFTLEDYELMIPDIRLRLELIRGLIQKTDSYDLSVIYQSYNRMINEYYKLSAFPVNHGDEISEREKNEKLRLHREGYYDKK